MNKKLMLLLVPALALLGILTMVPGDASAASQTVNLSFSGSGGTHTWLTGEVVCDECLPDVLINGICFSNCDSWGIGATVELDGQATWNPGPASTALQYSAGNIRQGSTVDLTDTLTPQPGTVTINYSVPLTYGIFGTFSTAGGSCDTPSSCNTIGWQATTSTTSTTITASDAIPCTTPLPGDSPRDCTKSFEITLFDGNLFSIIGAKITLPITETVTVTGSGVTSLRVAMVAGGAAIANNNLSFGGSSPSTVADPIFISCSQPVGSDLLYSMTQNAYTADPMTWGGSVNLKIVATALGFDIPVANVNLVTLSGFTLGPVPMTAPDQQADLGPVQANSTPPTITSVGGPYSGNEGSPIQFNGSATSVCGAPTLRWDFSDGGVAFGESPQHTFADGPVTYSGLLTATDATGLTTTATFSVQVNNVSPTVDGGPDKASLWGVPVAFHANGADAGAVDNGSLLYTWDFGDPNSPIGTAGQDVSHVYSMPGTYTAMVTVHDKDGGTGTDTVQVTVTQRATTLVYTGPVQSLPNKRVTLTAMLTDELAQPVAGATVTFTLGSQTVTGVTNGSGVATASLPLNQKIGSYPLNATFAGTAKYLASAAAAGTFKIGNK